MALTDKLTAIGNAIREKNGTSDLIPLADMPQAILDISGGGNVEYIEYPLPQDNYVYYRYPPCNEERYVRINKSTIEYGKLNVDGYVKEGTMNGIEDGVAGSGGGTKNIYKFVIPAHKQDFIIKLSTIPVYAQSTADCTEVYCGAVNWESVWIRANMYQCSSTTIGGIQKITINVPNKRYFILLFLT